MRTGAKKSPSYRVVVKEKQSKRDGAYLENLGTYNPTRNHCRDQAELDLELNYWIEKGAQPTDTVSQVDQGFSESGERAVVCRRPNCHPVIRRARCVMLLS